MAAGLLIEFGPCDRRGLCDVFLTMASRPTHAGCRIQWLIDGNVLGPPQPPGVQVARRRADGEIHVLEVRILALVGSDDDVLLAQTERVRFPVARFSLDVSEPSFRCNTVGNTLEAPSE